MYLEVHYLLLFNSLSVIIYEMFSGRNSFPGEFWEVFNAKRMDVKPGFPDNFDPDLRDLIDKGWSREPRRRPAIKEYRSFFGSKLTTIFQEDGNSLHEEKLGNQFHFQTRYSRDMLGILR